MGRAYISIISARYRTLLQYRAAAIAGFATQLFWGAIKIMVFFAFYKVTSDTQPMSLPQVVTYIWLGQAFLGMLPWNVDKEIEGLIREGAVSYELVRPLDLYNFWFCRTIALRTATTTLRSIPMILFAMLILPFVGAEAWSMQTPPDLSAFACFVVSMLAALAMACAFTMLMHVFLVWTISGEGLNRIMPSLTLVFSGMVVPLPLFPDWLQPFLDLQPFRGLVDVPFRIYSGHISALNAWPDLLHQLIWTAVFVLIGRWLLARSLRQLVVQGG
jgi:ABC-2 type transport system permease protein